MNRHGEVISARYRLLEEAGRNSLGAVYRAADLSNGNVISVTVVESALASDSAYRTRLRQRVHRAAKIRSPRIVQPLEVVEDGRGVYVVTQLVEGESLAACLTRIGKLPLPDTLLIAREISLALEDAEQQQIVHGHLSTEEVRLVGHTIRVAGFGMVLPEDGSASHTKLQLRQAEYRAPECFAGEGDIRADIYALGIILYRMLTGRGPSRAGTTPRQVQPHASRPVPALPSGLPAGLYLVADRCLAKQPEKRYASPYELSRALRQLVRALGQGQVALSEAVSSATVPAPAHGAADSAAADVQGTPSVPAPTQHRPRTKPTATDQVTVPPSEPAAAAGPKPPSPGRRHPVRPVTPRDAEAPVQERRVNATTRMPKATTGRPVSERPAAAEPPLGAGAVCDERPAAGPWATVTGDAEPTETAPDLGVTPQAPVPAGGDARATDALPASTPRSAQEAFTMLGLDTAADPGLIELAHQYQVERCVADPGDGPESAEDISALDRARLLALAAPHPVADARATPAPSPTPTVGQRRRFIRLGSKGRRGTEQGVETPSPVDPYQLLGVHPEADVALVTIAYRHALRRALAAEDHEAIGALERAFARIAKRGASATRTSQDSSRLA